ncbi:MAG: BtaA family protein [Myxococcales bacterium]|nr:BtaA family protein [Myxococcales bacterium]
MSLRNFAFQRAFAKLFVYNILFEDSESDERYLGLDENSSILSITGAGCGVASMMSRRPQRLDAVDINRHHLALAGLKVIGAQHLADYDIFYQLLGRGYLPKDAQGTVASLGEHMPAWMANYWRRHWRRFSRNSIYMQGLTSRMLMGLRKMSGTDALWLTDLIEAPVEERERAIDAKITPVLTSPFVRMLMASPIQLLALGINFNQRDKILESEGDENLMEFYVNHLKRLAHTDLATNWFVWHAATGHFNHDHPDAVPPYLRRDRHERSSDTSPTTVRFHHGNIFDRLENAGTNTWTHYTLCDAPDWMPQDVQSKLLDEIFRTSKDGAIVLARSVEQDSFIERIDDGKRFQLLENESNRATMEDRSRQYRRVDFFRVNH